MESSDDDVFAARPRWRSLRLKTGDVTADPGAPVVEER